MKEHRLARNLKSLMEEGFFDELFSLTKANILERVGDYDPIIQSEECKRELLKVQLLKNFDEEIQKVVDTIVPIRE